MNRDRELGFTLVELAIVIAIIGLLVGGVLVGMDIIRNASIRTVVADLERINSGATTFNNKYSGLPGDLLASKAESYGFDAGNSYPARPTNPTQPGQGDGNGLVEGCSLAATALGCETALFWKDISTVGLTPTKITGYDATATPPFAPALTTAQLANSYLPRSKLRDLALYTIIPHDGRNYIALGAISVGASNALQLGTGLSASVAPLEAHSVDEKMDDARPTTGIVMAISNFTTDTGATIDTGAPAAANVCVADSTPAAYNVVTEAYAVGMACGLIMRASF